jgi:hypothetical protein
LQVGVTRNLEFLNAAFQFQLQRLFVTEFPELAVGIPFATRLLDSALQLNLGQLDPHANQGGGNKRGGRRLFVPD